MSMKVRPPHHRAPNWLRWFTAAAPGNVFLPGCGKAAQPQAKKYLSYYKAQPLARRNLVKLGSTRERWRRCWLWILTSSWYQNAFVPASRNFL